MIDVIEYGILCGRVCGTELQHGIGLITSTSLADAQTAGSVCLELCVLLTVLRILYQILGTDVNLGYIRDAAVFYNRCAA